MKKKKGNFTTLLLILVLLAGLSLLLYPSVSDYLPPNPRYCHVCRRSRKFEPGSI